MSETKWTPGPWGIRFNGGPVGSVVSDRLNRDDWGVLIVFPDGFALGSVGAALCTADRPANVVNANAHLIAAAPDLYAALAEFERVFQSNGPIEMGGGLPAHMGISKAISMAIAALAKARGEA